MTKVALTNDLMSVTDYSEKCWAYQLPNFKKVFIPKSQAEFRQDENGVVSLFVADWLAEILHREHKAKSFIFVHQPEAGHMQERFGDLVVNKPVVEVVKEKSVEAVKITTTVEDNTISADLMIGDTVVFEKEFRKTLSQMETSEITGRYDNPDFIRKQVVGFLAETGTVVDIVRRKTKQTVPPKNFTSMSRQRIFKNNLLVKTSAGKFVELDIQHDLIKKA